VEFISFSFYYICYDDWCMYFLVG